MKLNMDNNKECVSVSDENEQMALMLLQLSSTNAAKKPGAKLKALVYWIQESSTSIVDGDTIVNPQDLEEGMGTGFFWKAQGRKTTHRAKIIKIGSLAELKPKQVEIDTVLGQAATVEKTNPKKRGRRRPSIFEDYVLEDVENESDPDVQKKKEVLKKKKENEEKKSAHQKQCTDLIAIEPVWSVQPTASLVRVALDSLQEDNEPVVQFPESQDDYLDLDNQSTSSVSTQEPEQIVLQSVDMNIPHIDENRGIAMTQLEKDLESERLVNKLLQEEIDRERNINKQLQQEKENLKSGRGQCPTCKFLHNAAPQQPQKFIQRLYDVMKGQCAPEEISSNGSPSVQTPNYPGGSLQDSHGDKEELYPGSTVWLSSSNKMFAVLKANGNPDKLVTALLNIMFEKKDLGKLSARGQRTNEAIPEKVAKSIHLFVNQVCKGKNGLPAISEKEFNSLLNRRFASARRDLKVLANKNK